MNLVKGSTSVLLGRGCHRWSACRGSSQPGQLLELLLELQRELERESPLEPPLDPP